MPRGNFIIIIIVIVTENSVEKNDFYQLKFLRFLLIVCFIFF